MNQALLALLLLGGVATSHARTPQPSTLSPEKCLAKLPSEKRVAEGYREYYLKFADSICSEEPSKDAEWQQCILNSLGSGKVKPDNISQAYNDCNPEIRGCRADMRKAAGRASAGAREFFDSFCLAQGNATPTERACVMRYALKDEYFWRYPDAIYSLCPDEAQPCVQDFLADGAPHSNQFLAGIGIACKRPIDLIDKDVRDCMKEEFKLGQYKDNPEDARLVCVPEARKGRDCLHANYAHHNERVGKPAIRNRDDLNNAIKLCATPPTKSRECVVEHFKSGLSVSEAEYVCRFASSDTRACLDEFLMGKGSYGATAFKDLRDDLQWQLTMRTPITEFGVHLGGAAATLCGISNLTDRACALKAYVAAVARKAPTPGTAITVRDKCLRDSSERRDCARAIAEALPKDLPADEFGEGNSGLGAICDIPTFEIRRCILNKLPELAKSHGSLDSLTAACSGSFMRYMFRPIDGVGDGMECKFKR